MPNLDREGSSSSSSRREKQKSPSLCNLSASDSRSASFVSSVSSSFEGGSTDDGSAPAGSLSSGVSAEESPT